VLRINGRWVYELALRLLFCYHYFTSFLRATSVDLNWSMWQLMRNCSNVPINAQSANSTIKQLGNVSIKAQLLNVPINSQFAYPTIEQSENVSIGD
jgi:hypothetical protein